MSETQASLNVPRSNAGKRVLLVEDDEDVRMLVAAELEDHGYLVVQAANGLAALDAIDAARPDLIVLDMRMPVMDGWHFIVELQRRHGRVSPILVTSAAADARQRALDVGADGWLAKPFDLDELFDAVDRLVVTTTR